MAKERKGETLWLKPVGEDEVELRWHLNFTDGTDHPFAKRGLKIPYRHMPAVISTLQKYYRYMSAYKAKQSALSEVKG